VLAYGLTGGVKDATWKGEEFIFQNLHVFSVIAT
jgi:hypothetical protein